jgi:hypothetical protein
MTAPASPPPASPPSPPSTELGRLAAPLLDDPPRPAPPVAQLAAAAGRRRRNRLAARGAGALVAVLLLVLGVVASTDESDDASLDTAETAPPTVAERGDEPPPVAEAGDLALAVSPQRGPAGLRALVLARQGDTEPAPCLSGDLWLHRWDGEAWEAITGIEVRRSEPAGEVRSQSAEPSCEGLWLAGGRETWLPFEAGVLDGEVLDDGWYGLGWIDEEVTTAFEIGEPGPQIQPPEVLRSAHSLNARFEPAGAPPGIELTITNGTAEPWGTCFQFQLRRWDPDRGTFGLPAGILSDPEDGRILLFEGVLDCSATTLGPGESLTVPWNADHVLDQQGEDAHWGPPRPLPPGTYGLVLDQGDEPVATFGVQAPAEGEGAGGGSLAEPPASTTTSPSAAPDTTAASGDGDTTPGTTGGPPAGVETPVDPETESVQLVPLGGGTVDRPLDGEAAPTDLVVLDGTRLAVAATLPCDQVLAGVELTGRADVVEVRVRTSSGVDTGACPDGSSRWVASLELPLALEGRPVVAPNGGVTARSLTQPRDVRSTATIGAYDPGGGRPVAAVIRYQGGLLDVHVPADLCGGVEIGMRSGRSAEGRDEVLLDFAFSSGAGPCGGATELPDAPRVFGAGN